MNGSFDGKSAPFNAIYVAGTLQDSNTTIIPGAGHGALFAIQMPADAPARACTQSVVASFLSNPLQPDTSCVASLTVPPFTTTGSQSSPGTLNDGLNNLTLFKEPF